MSSDSLTIENTVPKIDQEILIDIDHGGRDSVAHVDVFALYVSRDIDGKPNTSIFETNKIESPRRRSEHDVGAQLQSSNFAGVRWRGARTGKLPNQSRVETVTSVPSPRKEDYISAVEKAQGFNWLSDENALPSFLPVATIIGFNIDLKSSTHAPVDFDAIAKDIASRITTIRAKSQRRAVVFIGHGYGTIVLKRLLSDQFHEIMAFRSSTAAVLFFGAPFLHLDPLLKWTAQSLKLSMKENIFGSKSVRDLVSSPESWSRFLRDLKDQNISSYGFLQQDSAANEYTGEERQVYGSRDLRADLDRYVETTSGIGDIAKFAGLRDANFRRMCSHIAAAVQTHQFLEAVKRGDADEVRFWLNRSVDCNTCSMTGDTALHIATRKKFLHILRLLREVDKIDLDRQDEDGRTALHLAVLRNDTQIRIGTTTYYKDIDYSIIDELLAAGSNPTILDRNGYTPRRIAHYQDAPKSIQDLLRKPQLVRGRSHPERMKKERHFSGARRTACEETIMSFKEVYAANDPVRGLIGPEKPDMYHQIFVPVWSLIYEESSVREFFRHVHANPTSEVAISQWFHIPMNNVRNPNLCLIMGSITAIANTID